MWSDLKIYLSGVVMWRKTLYVFRIMKMFLLEHPYRQDRNIVDLHKTNQSTNGETSGFVTLTFIKSPPTRNVTWCCDLDIHKESPDKKRYLVL